MPFFSDLQRVTEDAVDIARQWRETHRSEHRPAAQFTADLEERWNNIGKPNIPTVAPLSEEPSDGERQEHHSLTASRDRNVDLVRGTLDVLGRQIVIGPILSGEVSRIPLPSG